MRRRVVWKIGIFLSEREALRTSLLLLCPSKIFRQRNSNFISFLRYTKSMWQKFSYLAVSSSCSPLHRVLAWLAVFPVVPSSLKIREKRVCLSNSITRMCLLPSHRSINVYTVPYWKDGMNGITVILLLDFVANKVTAHFFFWKMHIVASTWEQTIF